jgi:hypothetical protein
MSFGDFTFVQLPFDKDGNITAIGPIDGTHAREQLLAMAPQVDDLIVISHGWNNDVNDAQRLYDGFFKNVRAQWNAAGLTQQDSDRTGILAVYWPSKRFDEPGQVTGGAAGIGDPAPAEADYQALIEAQIANLKDEHGQFPPEQQALLDQALAASRTLDDAASQTAFVVAMAKLMPAPLEPDPGLDVLNVRAAQQAGPEILRELATQLGGTTGPPADLDSGGAASIGAIGTLTPPDLSGGAAGISFGDLKQAAWMLLNGTTYYVMKERAGLIGPKVTPLVLEAMAKNPKLRVQLVGHSFGGRLVTALANALPAGGPAAATMTLLQAAYSHYGLAPAPPAGAEARPVGAFRSVIEQKKVRGQIQITHSNHDWAVGAGYPIASAIMRQTAAFITVPSTAGSLWGGMGANGAQQTPESYDTDLLDGHVSYPPPAASLPAPKRTIRNLNGNAFIAGHGDITGSQVTWAFLQAFAGSRS